MTSSRTAPATLLLNPHFWTISALTVIIAIGYYGESVGIADWSFFGRKVFSSEYTHDVHRALLLIPMFYAAAMFGLKGAIVSSVVQLCTVIPRGAFVSEYPDPLFRAVVFALVAGSATVLLGLEGERRRRLWEERERGRALAEERARLASIVAYSEDAIIGKTLDGIITSWNRGAELLYGYRAQEAIGKHISILAPPDLADDIPSIIEAIRRGESTERYETIRVRKDGSQVYVSLTVSPIRDDKDGIVGASTIARDVTLRKQAELALSTSERKYRTLFDNTSEGIILRDLEGNITMANRAMSALTGYALDELSGMNITSLLSEESHERVMAKQRALLGSSSEASTERYELQMIRKDGTERIIEAITTLLADHDGSISVLATLRDVTEQRRVRDSIRAYAAQVTRAQEDERKRVARELHDETIQALASLGLAIDALVSRRPDLPADISEGLERLRDRTDEILHGVRRFSQDLRPPVIDALGLADGLQWLIDDLKNQSPIDASLQIVGPEHRFSPDSELALFRIAQEALTNVRKHSSATQVTTLLEFSGSRVRITITDNGIAFDTSNAEGARLAASGKLGLVGMQERARLLGASLAIDSEPGKGTTVTVELET